MIWKRDAMNFYRGYIARSAMDIPAIEERFSTLPHAHRGNPSRPPQPLHEDLKSVKCSIPMAISPDSGHRKTVTASMVAQKGGRSKKPNNAGPSIGLDDAMLEEYHSEANSWLKGSGKIEDTVPKPTPAPRFHTSFRVEAMIHNPNDANL